jgi:hypothetical protein
MAISDTKAVKWLAMHYGMENFRNARISTVHKFLIEQINIKSGIKTKLLEIQKPLIDFSFHPGNSKKLFLSLSNKMGFATSEIIIYNLDDKKTKTIIGGNDNFFYNYITPFDNEKILLTRSFIPDNAVPKFSTMEIIEYNSTLKTSKILTGGSTNYDSKGKKSGFKATFPHFINDFKIGFLKIVDNFDKYYSTIEYNTKNSGTAEFCLVASKMKINNPKIKSKNIYGPDFSMISPKLCGDNLYFLERKDESEDLTLVSYNLEKKEKTPIAENVLIFFVKK